MSTKNPQQLPDFLIRDLEDGSATTGPDYLRGLGKNLMDKFA